MSDVATKLSLSLQDIAALVEDEIQLRAGEPCAFVLVVQAGKTAQYISNASREDGAKLIESLLVRWKANRADIPAHYNPDLKG